MELLRQLQYLIQEQVITNEVANRLLDAIGIDQATRENCTCPDNVEQILIPSLVQVN